MPTIPNKIISVDTETTGIDFHHGAKPFLVTTCDENENVLYWEWDVDPLTREPLIPQKDVAEIRKILNGAAQLVLQNPKFDVKALASIGVIREGETLWPKIVDTLLAGHLLASNQPHDLTSMALIYLGVNIQEYEDAVEQCVKDCLKLVRKKHKKEVAPAHRLDYSKWMVAKKGLECMPSAKEKTWKFDMWLPRAISKVEGYSADHEYNSALAEYANVDSMTTIALWKVMLDEMKRRGVYRIYQERLKLLPIVDSIESYGVSMSGGRQEQSIIEYTEESGRLGKVCVNLASRYNHTLVLPKSGNNKSLMEFVFSPDKLNLPIVGYTDKGAASLDKKSVSTYLATLKPRSKELTFVRCLSDKRSRDTAISYLEGYKKFRVEIKEHYGWYRLHPSLNMTGTHTLRWSSSNPNEQNISKKEGFNLRYCFGPAPGREWWSADAQNIELRLPAYAANEPDLIDLFEHPNDPPYYGSTHLLNFHTVYPHLWDKELKEVGLEKVGPHCKKKYAATWYQWVKNGGFAIQYGAQEATGDAAFKLKGCYKLLKARFNKLETLNQSLIDLANTQGYIETMPDKTVDPSKGYPLYCSTNSWGKISPTIPLNYYVQGTAMWWMMKAMIRCQGYLDMINAGKPRSQWVHMVMQVHDELVFDFPGSVPGIKNKDPALSHNLIHMENIRRLMAMGGNDIGVPTPVSVEYHPDNWSEGITVKA